MANYKIDKATAEILGEMLADWQKTPKQGASIRLEGRGRSTVGFWAKIGTSNDEGRYSWTALKIDNGNFVEDKNWGSGSHDDDGGFAAEKYQSKHVPEGAVVWMEVFPTEHVYIFEFTETRIATLTSDITARDDDTLGQGTATIDGIDDGELESSAITVTVYNHKQTGFNLGTETKVLIVHALGHWIISDQQDGFWAQITGKSGRKYAWTQYLPNNDGTYSAGSLSGTTSSNWAQASDGTEWVLPYSVVFIKPSGKGFFVFDYAPGVMQAKTESTDGGIPGRQGHTPGQKSVILEWFNGIALNEQEGITLTVYNNNRTAVEVDVGKTIYLTLAYGQTVWWLISYDCQDEDNEEEEY